MPSLTSFSLVFLISALVVVLLAGLFWVWPKLSRRGARNVLLRVVALCAVQASALSLIFVVVNYQFVFYSSWTDLLGRYTSGGALVRLHVGPVNPAAPLVVRASAPVAAKGSKTGGTLQAIRIRGGLSGITATGHVYLPPGYPGKHRTYPVILVISAAGARSAYGASQLAAAATNAIASGKLQPVIMVMLPPTSRSDPGCLDLPGGAQGATFFAQDVPDAVRSAYQASPAPAGWALLGDRSGGYCALQLALTSAFSFSAAAVPPASYLAPPGGFPRGTLDTFRSAENPQWIMRHYPMQPVSVLFTGTGGVNPFRQLAHPPMRTASMAPKAGPAGLAPVLKWLRSRLTTGTGA